VGRARPDDLNFLNLVAAQFSRSVSELLRLSHMGRRVPVPDSVRIALATFFGDGVAHIEVIEYAFFARMHWNALATTRRRRIYLRGSSEDFFNDPALMLHEYFHVVKQWEPRLLTSVRYVVECLRRGYWNNRFEVEARQFTADHVYRFQLLLSGKHA
jgi:hypothetical protein